MISPLQKCSFELFKTLGDRECQRSKILSSFFKARVFFLNKFFRRSPSVSWKQRVPDLTKNLRKRRLLRTCWRRWVTRSRTRSRRRRHKTDLRIWPRTERWESRKTKENKLDPGKVDPCTTSCFKIKRQTRFWRDQSRVVSFSQSTSIFPSLLVGFSPCSLRVGFKNLRVRSLPCFFKRLTFLFLGYVCRLRKVPGQPRRSERKAIGTWIVTHVWATRLL